MSDRNLRLQVVLNAVDKLTRPFKQARASTQELAAAVKKSRDALKKINQTSSQLDGYRKLQAESQKLGDRLSYARQRASMLSNELGQMGPPSQRQIVALERQRLAVQRLEERHGRLQQKAAQVRAELYRVGISANDGASATARITRETEKYNRQLADQEARLRRVGEQQRKMNAAREQYSKTLEMRDKVAGAGAAMTAAGVGMGAPVVAAVKSYASLEDAMKGVAKQVNGLRDDNGNRTAQFYELQAAIKMASEQLPLQNGAVDYAALVEGGARMGVGENAKTWAELKKELLDFASVSAKAATAFELPADQLAEDLGKIAGLYKVPTNEIERLGDVINYLDDNAKSKGADIINVMQRMGGVADKLDFRKAAALGSTFLTLGAAPEVAASASNAMVRELSIASMQSKSFMDGMNALKLKPAQLEKDMARDSMGTITRVLEMVNRLPKDRQMNVLTQLFGKEFGDDAGKLANNMGELYRQLGLVKGAASTGSMQKESDINKDSLSAQWMLVKAGTANVMSGLGETLRGPLMEIMGYIKQVTGGIRRWVEANPELAGRMMKVAAVVAAVTVALGTLAIALAAVLGPLALLRFGASMLSTRGLARLSPLLGGLGKVFTSLGPGLNISGAGFQKLFGLFSGGEAGEAVSWLDKIRNALGSFGGDAEDKGLLDAFTDGAMGKIKEHAQQAGEALVASVRNPMVAIRALGTQLRGMAALAFAPLLTSVRGAGGVLRWLVMSPLALLRTGLMFLSGALTVLLSPIGLVVAALAGVALVVWKYWEPIKAFLGGVVEGFKAASAPIAAAFEPLRPVFQWIGDKVQALWGWFTDLLNPVKSTSQELQSAAGMGRQFGEALADGLSMVMHPLETLKSGVSWLLEKLGIVSKEAAKAKLPEQVARQQPATVSSDGRVTLPAGGSPYAGYGMPGFAGFHDNGGVIPRGQWGVVGENGPEIVNGPARITSRRRTAALAAAAAFAFSGAAQPAAAAMTPFTETPVSEYRVQPPPRAVELAGITASTRRALPQPAELLTRYAPELPEQDAAPRRAESLTNAASLAFGNLSRVQEPKPLHPLSLPAVEYREEIPRRVSAPVVTQPVSIHAPISIYAQPGQSAADIASEVARQLDERERRASARTRSNFSDMGDFE
ncbi:phage tail tape measure protein [Pseudescherichia sp.]|uniref:phage tail tape measure protein n=1 Tax=Pseudescherichia sp. TaxID=2055881 RepID=UPI0039175A6C